MPYLTAQDWQKIQIIFITGPPGGNQHHYCSLIAQQHKDYIHLDIAGHLRALCCSPIPHDTVFGDGIFGGLNRELIRSFVNADICLPPKFLVAILKQRVEKLFCGKEVTILLDSFPVELEAGMRFEQECKMPTSVWDIECGYEDAKQRFLQQEGALYGNDREALVAFERMYRDWERHRPGVVEIFGLAMIPIDMVMATNKETEEEEKKRTGEKEAYEKRLSEWGRRFEFPPPGGPSQRKVDE